LNLKYFKHLFYLFTLFASSPNSVLQGRGWFELGGWIWIDLNFERLYSPNSCSG
jgi:hypothetical protein